MTAEHFIHLTLETSLVGGILKSCGLRPCDPYYKDYRQEVCLHLWQLWHRCANNPHTFSQQAFTYGRSRLLDSLRKEKNKINTVEILPEHDAAIPLGDGLTLEDFLQQLTPLQQNICHGLFHQEQIKKIAEKNHLSRGKIYRELTQIRQVAKNYFI